MAVIVPKASLAGVMRNGGGHNYHELVFRAQSSASKLLLCIIGYDLEVAMEHTNVYGEEQSLRTMQ